MHSVKNRYDRELQMYVDEVHDLDISRLRFIRWLVEHGRMDHGVMGIPVGRYAYARLIEKPAL
jgi:hypothetical protein